MDNNLQRCPNCGCGAYLNKIKRNSYYRFKYECGDCWTETQLHYSEESARKEWNSLIKEEHEEF